VQDKAKEKKNTGGSGEREKGKGKGKREKGKGTRDKGQGVRQTVDILKAKDMISAASSQQQAATLATAHSAGEQPAHSVKQMPECTTKTKTYFPNRDELLFLVVLALPKASITELAARILRSICVSAAAPHTVARYLHTPSIGFPRARPRARPQPHSKNTPTNREQGATSNKPHHHHKNKAKQNKKRKK
jgi:hypothetical protein